MKIVTIMGDHQRSLWLWMNTFSSVFWSPCELKAFNSPIKMKQSLLPLFVVAFVEDDKCVHVLHNFHHTIAPLLVAAEQGSCGCELGCYRTTTIPSRDRPVPSLKRMNWSVMGGSVAQLVSCSPANPEVPGSTAALCVGFFSCFYTPWT